MTLTMQPRNRKERGALSGGKIFYTIRMTTPQNFGPIVAKG